MRHQVDTNNRFRGVARFALVWLIGCLTVGGGLLASGFSSSSVSEQARPALNTKAIQDIRVGDWVLAKDPNESGAPTPHQVIALPRNWTEHIAHVQVEGGSELQATRAHPFWVRGKGWMQAKDLRTGDALEDSSGRSVVVERVRIEDRDVNTYNLTVEGVHTFFALAGDVPVLVHNQARTYQTYTKPDTNGGPPYSGRTSGTGTPDENVAARDAGHDYTNRGYGPAELDQSSANPDAIRGREQQLIDQNGGAQSDGGTAPNKIRGVAESNPNAEKYNDAANDEFGPCP
jgi:hypothetical protein